MIDFIITLLLFLFIFGLLVFVHEMGHYLAARMTGTKVLEFAIGLGPEIISRQGKETKWVLRAIPFGGYCQIEGQEEEKETPDSYTQKTYLQKLMILLGGVTMNFLLAVVIYYVLIGLFTGFRATFPKQVETDYLFGKQSVVKVTTTGFSEVIAGSPAEKADIKKDGKVVEIGGEEILTPENLQAELAKYKEKEVEIKVSYVDGGVKDEVETYKVTPTSEGKIGIRLDTEEAYVIEYQGVERVFVGFANSINLLQFQVVSLVDLVTQSADEGSVVPVAKNVSSPIGIFKGVSWFSKLGGVLGIIHLIGLLSLALAFFNIIPFPALDGGHVFILTLEKVTGRNISPQVQNTLALIGFLVLMALMVLTTAKDLIQFGVFDIVKSWF